MRDPASSLLAIEPRRRRRGAAVPGLALRVLAAVATPAAGLRAADRAAELAAWHLAATGGAARVAALHAIRATGEVAAGGRSVRFTLLAARPDRVRLETEAEGRTRVQGADGAEPPWEHEPAAAPPRSAPMSAAAARTFAAEAEFDDPLIAGAARGYALDEAGFAELDGVRHPRLLVTRPRTEPFFLILDPVTYLIVRRTESRSGAAGRKTEIVTRYADFRPVQGVLLPHRIEVAVDGRVTQETRIERIEANPPHEPEDFRLPRAPQNL
jgi:hypothetical protein